MAPASRSDEDKLLRSVSRWKKKKKDRTSPLSQVVRSYMDRNQPVFEKNAEVVEAWRDILPEHFYDHCQLAAIDKGVIRIEVDSGPFMHEMRLLSGELLEHLKSRCPRAKLKKIVLCPRKARQDTEEEK
ncbi:Zn-ribbon-containing, putative RNA-binding protein [Anaerohalosphaera lusitana]|uniref:Zn-ribbon-containing, putative RNA-binding protein n=1 Tax=Anaerohalosphaera lusitana TaxID=1936003 RepID=A0A1U9NHA3_9BACT|nr:DUF721 domain-containing protein [Anaerohalosphaera lusitana]AQT67312.1 Zn-ribbon-containing, putative RNA-binding protein [Anaerohalosphaera lusitana]